VTPVVLVQAWQSWKSARTVFALAVIALGVGIASTTAIYTVVNAVMLKPLAYDHGERYGQLFSATVGNPDGRGSLMLADLLQYRQAQSFDLFGWFKPQSFSLTAPGLPQHVEGAAVTTRLARNLGIQPALGQWFEDEHGAVISRSLWMRLGGDPHVLGTAIVLNGRLFTLTGIMPDRFRLPEVTPGGENARTDVWIGLDPDGKGLDPADGFLFSYARLKPGVTFEQAAAEVKNIAAEIARSTPGQHEGYTAALDPLSGLVGKSIRPTLLLLLGAAGVLLLITCANVAALLLARAVARARDTAIRVALGAGHGQLAFQYFIEGLIVSLAGAALGVLASVGLVRAVVGVAADFVPRADEVAIDWRVLLFALGTAALASALSSLAPLWQATRMPPNAVLTEGVRASAGIRTRRLSRSLVTAEIALAFALVAVSGVLIAHLDAVSRIWPGFDPRNLLTFELTLPDAIASTQDRLVPYQMRLVDTLRTIPGVTGVAFANQAPLDGCCLSTALYPEGRPPGLEAPQRTAFVPISPGFFDTMRIPLKRGRLLTYDDAGREDPLPVVINETASRHNWPDRSAEGAFGRISSPDGSRFQVIGIVGDIRNDGLNKAPVAEVYLLHNVTTVNPMQVFVRSALPPETLVSEVRRTIERLDPAQPIHGVATFADIVQQSVTLERLGSFMTSFFALAALLMATLGIYGVVSYSVRQRTVEIGTRMALGAGRRDLLRLVVGGGLEMAALGITFGGVAVAAVVWLLTREFEIREVGPLPFASATAIVAGVAGAASFFPAWRATLLSPLVAIRDQPGSIWQAARQGMQAAVAGLSRAVAGDEGTAIRLDGSLLTDFVDAARVASSNREALRIALSAFRRTVGAEWAMLLEHHSGTDYHCAASAAENGFQPRALPAAGFLLNRLRFHSFPLPLSSADLDACAQWAREQAPFHVPEIEALGAIGARMAVPLRTKREILGILLLGGPTGGAEYRAVEKQLLRTSADLFALMLENTRLTDRVVEEEKLRRDLALAGEVQKRLLPDRSPDSRIAAIAAVSVPARIVGGDYYDFLEIGDHRIGIALADVSGKGVAAALIMSVVHASLRIISADADIPLPQLASRMNSFLHRCTQANKYATFFYAQLDERCRQLRYVNAGHNPPYLVTAREIQELSTGGSVIGLFPDMPFEEGTVDMQPGDLLVMFTDGVTEALNVDGEEFGEARLKMLVRAVCPLPVQEISSRLVDELRTWTNGAAQYDDLTFVLLKMNESSV
jgi:putative ABC transport system permease protein